MAKKKDIEPPKRPVGRPTLYKPEYNDQAHKLALLGATDKDMADFFEVNPDTITEWKNKFPEFSVSLKAGKDIADMHLASKLYNRAEGAEWIQEQAFKVKKTKYENGKKIEDYEEVVTVPVKMAAPPDTTALIFWLKNRKSSAWRDKIEHDHTITIEKLNQTIALLENQLGVIDGEYEEVDEED